jgi:probable H4MPT-linked C1 transfer pathway protein
MSSLALDIGGANLKAADGLGWASSVPFSLSSEPERLAAALGELVGSAPASARLAVTMTGELCDAFRTKAEGVRCILKAVEAAAAGREILVYLVDGRLVSVDEASERPLLAAASNWHALAQFACRFVGERAGLLIDVGSTTTDVVPIVGGRVAARGANDTDRLLASELVYTGVGRTPLCAVTHALPYRGRECPVAAELFATTADAYVVLGELPERPMDTGTADGRPLTRLYARERLARMICADGTTFDDRDARYAAEAIRALQLAQLRNAVDEAVLGMPVPLECFVVSGAGEFLAVQLAVETQARGRVISLTSQLGAIASVCAPAHALAVLAREARRQ